jgi:serine/threonine protein kinase
MTLGRPGALLADRYRLDRLVGSAGSTERWLAYDERLARPVTARLTPASGDAAYEEAAQAALERMARINHPGVAAVYDVGTAEDLGGGATSYAISEWTRGRTLEQIMATGPQPWSRTADWGRQISGALAALHSVGLVHGALRPNSVAIHDDRRVKILDAGLGAAGDEDADERGSHGAEAGAEAEAEAGRGDQGLPPGAADDIYALGFLLWEATVGAAPDFTAPDFMAPDYTAQDARRLDQQPLRQARVPAEMVGLLVGMLDADPARRPTADAVERGFGPFAATERSTDTLPQVEPVPDRTQVIVPTPAVGPAEPTGLPRRVGPPPRESAAALEAERERRRRRGLLIGLSALLAAIGAGIGLLLVSLNPSTGTSPVIGNTAVPSNSPGTVTLPSGSLTPTPSPAQTSAAPATSAAPSRSPSPSASRSPSASPSPSAVTSSAGATGSASPGGTSTGLAGPGASASSTASQARPPHQ